MYKICHAKNKMKCGSIDVLKTKLQQFRGMPVSIEFKTTRGVKCVEHIDVRDDGHVVYSHGRHKGTLFDFDDLASAHLSKREAS